MCFKYITEFDLNRLVLSIIYSLSSIPIHLPELNLVQLHFSSLVKCLMHQLNIVLNILRLYIL